MNQRYLRYVFTAIVVLLITDVRWWGSNLSTGGAVAAAAVPPPGTTSRPVPPSPLVKTTDEATKGPIAVSSASAADVIAGPGCTGDTCATAISVPSLPFAAGGDTCACVDNYDEICHLDFGSSGDVVFSYTPAADECLNISLCGATAYDSKLYVYENACGSYQSNNFYACNDDFCSSLLILPFVSELSMVVQGGNVYYIVVDGSGSCGGYGLDITTVPCVGACVDTGDCSCMDDVDVNNCTGPGQQHSLHTRCCEAECRAPGAQFDSLNMNLLSWVPLDQFFSGSTTANDDWGFTSPRGRKYAVIGLSRGTGFVDITEPRSPVIVADIPDSESIWSDMKVYWPYVYNANETGDGLQIIDVSLIDPPTRSVTLSRTLTQSGLQTTHTVAVNPDSGFLYLNGSNLGGLVAVSLADPANPQIIGQALEQSYVHDSQVVTYTSGPYAGREIAFCHDGGSGLQILDVTNKSNMFLLSTLTYPTLSWCHQGWLTEDRRYLIFNDEEEEISGLVSNTTVYVANVENLLAPFLAATFTHPTGCWIDHDGMVRGNRFYQAQYTAGLRVLDISNPLVPFETAYFDSHPEGNSQEFEGMWGSFSDFPTRLVIGSDIKRGLFVLCDEPEKPLASFVMDKASALREEPIAFDAASSTHCTPERSVVGYEWDFDYNGLSFDVDGAGVTIQHAYLQGGVYVVALRVTDDDSPAHTEISTLKVTVNLPPPVIVWNSDPLSSDRTTRSLRFKVEPPMTATATPGQSAIKVTMIDLQHPIPPNLPQFPAPNFSGFEVGTCGDPGGCARWVGKPGTFLESQDSPGIGNYRAARLQCTPLYLAWENDGDITVIGAEIAPSSEYSVQAYAASCQGAETGCTAVSPAVTMYTRRSGDVGPNFNPPSNSTQPDALDVAAVVNKLKNLPGALVKAIAQLQPNLPELNADVNALDVGVVVDGVKGKPYAYSGPCVCPSTVTCGATSCTAAGTCVTAYGAGSMCVKTCTGPGPLAGDPCINNSHCTGSGTCGAGFCRDRCGRCSP